MADGWEQARREVEIGAGALVRDLFRREQVSQAAPRPTTSPTLTPQPTPSFAGPVRPSAQGHLSGGPVGGAMSFLPPPAERFAAFTANFEARLKGVLQRAEAATVKLAGVAGGTRIRWSCTAGQAPAGHLCSAACCTYSGLYRAGMVGP